MRRSAIAAARRAREEGGFTLVEVMAAMLVLAVGLAALFQLLDVSAHATSRNRVRQAEISLARELAEDVRSLGYSQLDPTDIATALASQVSGATASGSTLTVTRAEGNALGTYSFTASFTACSLDDPSDGYGSHTSAPSSGGSWCSDVAASGTADATPDDYKRVSVTVTPTGKTTPAVQQTVLVYARATHGPAISCLSVNTTCPGANWSVTTGSSLPFNVTTTTPAASIEWFVNGSLPSSAQRGAGLDPYNPGGSTTSQFTWYFPLAPDNVNTIDGTYTISAKGFDVNGNSGTTGSLQVTVNEHMVLPPASVTAGYNHLINGVDVQWVPSVDQDVLYYSVWHQYGNNTAAVVPGCSQIVQQKGALSGLTCTTTDSTVAPSPGTEPSSCSTHSALGTPNNFWVVGWDRDPATGQPRQSTLQSTQVNANVCNNPPNAPTNLSASGGSGTVTLSWQAPAIADPDSGDQITYWRIYRWSSGSPARYDLIGSKTTSGGQVTTYTDDAADPGGVPQNYCVTAVDQNLDESPCSTPTATAL